MLNSIYKILKFRTPISIYSCFNLSNRKENLLHIPKTFSETFIYNGTIIWNMFLSCSSLGRSSLAEHGNLKSKVKELILHRQKMGDMNEWHTDVNFMLQ